MSCQRRQAYIPKSCRFRTETALESKVISVSVCGDGSLIKNDPRAFEIVLPILTLSEANGILSKTRFIKTGPNKGKPAREHWREAWERHKEQKRAIHLGLSPSREKLRMPCTIRLTRMGPRELDFDNLVISQKYIRDAVAEVITGDMRPGAPMETSASNGIMPRSFLKNIK